MKYVESSVEVGFNLQKTLLGKLNNIFFVPKLPLYALDVFQLIQINLSHNVHGHVT